MLLEYKHINIYIHIYNIQYFNIFVSLLKFENFCANIHLQNCLQNIWNYLIILL